MYLFIKNQPKMSDQEKKPQRIYHLFDAETKEEFLQGKTLTYLITL